VKQSLGQYEAIVLAGGWQIFPRHPLLNSLLLDGSQGEDGLLSVEELFGLKLRAGVVAVLGYQAPSPAETAGQDIALLARALRHAGAGRLIVTLWQSDRLSTGHVVKQFYRKWLQQTIPPHEALRRAQIELWREPATRHPSHWAHLVMYDG